VVASRAGSHWKKMDSNIGATRRQILRLRCTKFDFRRGSARRKGGKGEGTGEDGREKGKWREGGKERGTHDKCEAYGPQGS